MAGKNPEKVVKKTGVVGRGGNRKDVAFQNLQRSKTLRIWTNRLKYPDVPRRSG